MGIHIDGLNCGSGLDPDKGLWFMADPVDRQAMEDVGQNAASLPISASWEELDKGREDLARFPHIVICSSDERWRKQAVHEIGSRVLGVPLMAAGAPNGQPVAGFIRTMGTPAISALYVQAEDIPARGLVSLTKIPETPKKRHILSGFRQLDRVTGGFLPGELSVWTGKRGEGKSTLLGQILAEAVDRGETVFAFSGELTRTRFRDWVYLQFAGPDHVEAVTDDDSGRQSWVVRAADKYRLEEWLGDRFWLVDSTEAGANTAAGILALMNVALRQYGCSVFMLDNLMVAELEGQDYYRAQSEFVGKLAAFAKRNDVHIHLVAHPRKVGTAKVELDDVGGSGDIGNRADNAFTLARLNDDEAQKVGFSSLLTVMKNRETGVRGYKIPLDFDMPSRRYYPAGKTAYWDYGWVSHGFTLCDAPTPFDGM